MTAQLAGSTMQSVHLTKAAKLPYIRLVTTIHQFAFCIMRTNRGPTDRVLSVQIQVVAAQTLQGNILREACATGLTRQAMQHLFKFDM